MGNPETAHTFFIETLQEIVQQLRPKKDFEHPSEEKEKKKKKKGETATLNPNWFMEKLHDSKEVFGMARVFSTCQNKVGDGPDWQ